jgi:hypothetical protein
MHVCPEEIALLMTALPFVGAAFRWIKHKLGRSRGPRSG